MKCNECKQQVPSDSVFCPFCGAKIIKKQVTSTDKSSKVRSVSAASGKSNKSRKKKKTWLIVLIIMVLLLAGAAGGYYYSYTQAVRYADQRDFTSAGKYLVAPVVTNLHDPDLYDYIVAGLSYDIGNYETAKEMLFSLSQKNYRASKSMYKLAKDKYKEVLVDEVNALVKNCDSSGLDKARIAIQRGVITEEEYNTIKEKAYRVAQDAYYSGRKAESSKMFSKLDGYSRSADYLTLWNEGPASSVINLIGFADAEDIVSRKYIKEYLAGNWSSGVYYFNVIENYNVTKNMAIYKVESNLPGFNSYGDRYDFDYGCYKEFIRDDDPLGKDVFRFKIENKNEMQVFCCYNNQTISMQRA